MKKTNSILTLALRLAMLALTTLILSCSSSESEEDDPTDETNEVSSISDSDGSANEVTENAAEGTTVGITAYASDADSGDTVSYSLTDDANDLFTINSSSGVVTVASGASIDHETATSHNIEVKATSSDGTTASKTLGITVLDADEFDVGSIDDNDESDNVVASNAEPGTSVGITASAADADGSDKISYELSNDSSGRFTIDSGSGIVSTNDWLTNSGGSQYNVVVNATSTDGSSATAEFRIEVNEVITGDATNDIGGISDSDDDPNEVSEDAALGATVGITAYAEDADDGDSVTYALSDSSANKFAIGRTSGVVTVNAVLNGSVGSHGITVEATSTDGTSIRKSFGIKVLEGVGDDGEAKNYVSAIDDVNASENAVEENSANGTLVGITADASDADADDDVSYSLLNDADGRFAIDDGGVVSVADGSKIDFESNRAHTIEVLATSDDTSTSSAEFIISVTDEANEANQANAVSDPQDADGDSTNNNVDENATIGTTVGITASATDADGDDVSYSLARSANGRFKIDGATGVVTTAKALDYEADPSHDITINANSDDGSVASAEFTVAVNDDVAEASTTISGVAVDGYLEKANVCLDKDGDQKCTTSDGNIATTLADGSYSLDVDAGDAELYPVLVQVIAGETIDSDTKDEANPNGVVASKNSIMNAPAGKYSLVSPLTTLVQGKIAGNSGLDADAAERLVIDDLGLDSDSNLSLFDDYVAEKQNTDLDSEAQADYDFVHSVAQVVAQAIADNIAEVSDELEEATKVDVVTQGTFDEVVQIVVAEVAEGLSEVAEAVDDAIEQAEGDEEVNLTAVYQDIDDKLEVDADVSELEEEIALLEHEAEAQSGTSVADFMAAGFYDLSAGEISSTDENGEFSNICYVYSYTDYVFDWDNFYYSWYEYDANTGEFFWHGDLDDSPSYILTDGQWLYQSEEPAELLAEYDDGSIDVLFSRGEINAGGEVLDVTDENLIAYVANDYWAQALQGSESSTFEAGAEILSIYEENLYDSYWIDAESGCHSSIDGNMTASCSLLVEDGGSFYAKALTELFGDIIFRSGSLGAVSLKFDGGLDEDDINSSTGEVIFYDESNSSLIVAKADWHIVQLAGVDSLKFRVPPALLDVDDGADAPYYLVTYLEDTGALHYVEHTPAGHITEDAGTFFNRMAMDNILSVFNNSNQGSINACSLDHDDDGGDNGNGGSSDVVVSSEDGYKPNALISPNGGEEWFWYSQATVEWNADEFDNAVDLYVIADDNSDIFDSVASANETDIVNAIVNSNLNSIGTGLTNTGSHTFSAEIANASGNGYAVLIVDSEDNSIFDVSNAGFAITYQDDPNDDGDENDTSGNSYQSWNVNDIAGKTLYLVYEDLDYYLNSDQWESSGNVINTIQFADDYISDQSSNMHGAPYQGLFGHAEGAVESVGDLYLTWWIDGNGILHLAEDTENNDNIEMAKVSSSTDYYEIQAISDDDGSVFDDFVEKSALEYLYFNGLDAEAACADHSLGCSDSPNTNGPNLAEVYEGWNNSELSGNKYYFVSPESKHDDEVSFYAYYVDFQDDYLIMYDGFNASSDSYEVHNWSLAEDGVLDIMGTDNYYVIGKFLSLDDGSIQVVYRDDRDGLQGYTDEYEMYFPTESAANAYCQQEQDSDCIVKQDVGDLYQPWQESQLKGQTFYKVQYDESTGNWWQSRWEFSSDYWLEDTVVYVSFDSDEVNQQVDWHLTGDGVLEDYGEWFALESVLADDAGFQVRYVESDYDELIDVYGNGTDGLVYLYRNKSDAESFCSSVEVGGCVLDDNDNDGNNDSSNNDDYDDWHPDDFKGLTIYLVYTDYDYVNGVWQDVGNVISTVLFDSVYESTDDYDGGYVGIYSIADGAVDSVDSSNSISGEWKIHGSGILELDDLPGDDLYIGKLQEEGTVQMFAGDHDDIFDEADSEVEYFLTSKDEAVRLCGDPCYDSLDEAGASLNTMYDFWTTADLSGKEFYVVLAQDDDDLPYGYYQYYAEFNTTHLLWSYSFTGGEVEHVATWELSDDGIIDLVEVDNGGTFVLGKIATLQAANTGTSDEINIRFANTRDRLQNEVASYDYFFTDLGAAKDYCAHKEGDDCLIEIDLDDVYMPWQESEVSDVTWYNVYSDTDSDTGVTTWYSATYVFSADGTVTSYSGINAADGTSANDGYVLDWELDNDDLFLELSGSDYDGTEWFYYANLIGKYDTIDGGYKTNWGSEESDMYYFPTDYEELMYYDRSKAIAKCESVGGCVDGD